MSYVLYPQIGPKVWVGNFQACDEAPQKFQRTIHLWHPYQMGSGICALTADRVSDVQSPRESQAIEICGGLYVCFEDKKPLGNLLQPVWDYASNDDDLLIHCAAGLCRSPTIAILCLAARGIPPTLAVGMVCDAMWQGNRVAPHVSPGNLCEIFEFVESKARCGMNATEDTTEDDLQLRDACNLRGKFEGVCAGYRYYVLDGDPIAFDGRGRAYRGVKYPEHCR